MSRPPPTTTLFLAVSALTIVCSLHGRSCCTADTDAGYNKRSDDSMLGDLKILLQQQAAVIQRQSADIQALQAKMMAAENAATNRDNVLQKLQEKVAFTATFNTGGGIDIGQTAPIPFNHVTINTGNGYDPHTGIFTAPVSGIYLFLLHVKSDDTAPHTSTALDIVKSDVSLAIITVSGRNDEFHKSSISVAAQVSAGEKVFVRHHSGITLIDNWYETSFTGVLLFVD